MTCITLSIHFSNNPLIEFGQIQSLCFLRKKYALQVFHQRQSIITFYIWQQTVKSAPSLPLNNAGQTWNCLFFPQPFAIETISNIAINFPNLHRHQSLARPRDNSIPYWYSSHRSIFQVTRQSTLRQQNQKEHKGAGQVVLMTTIKKMTNNVHILEMTILHLIIICTVRMAQYNIVKHTYQVNRSEGTFSRCFQTNRSYMHKTHLLCLHNGISN